MPTATLVASLRLLLFVSFLSLSALAQEPTVKLQWKLEPGAKLAYATVMQEAEQAPTEPQDKVQQENVGYITELSDSGDGVVHIEMRAQSEPKADKGQLDPEAALLEMTDGLVLRGSVFASGGIESFWLQAHQKNLVALLFELPTLPVKVGDSWSLDVNLISYDFSFLCKKSERRNQATLVEIKTVEGEKTAVIDYDILESVDGEISIGPLSEDGKPMLSTMRYRHTARGEFSIDRGRWLSYAGELELNTTGTMSLSQCTKLQLIPKSKP